MNSDQRLLNHPIKLHWEGWETTAHTLKSVGWKLKIEQLIHTHAYRLIGKHPHLELYLIGEDISMTRLETMNYRYRLSPEYNEVICRINLATHINTIIHSSPSPIIADYGYPTMTDEPIKEFNIKEFFKETEARESQILTPEDVPDLLAKIIELQKPKQKEINKKLMMRNVKVKPVMQILKVA